MGHPSSSSPLPLECLRIIFQALAKDDDVATLSNLLQVNTHFCQAALPYLYTNPFHRWFHPQALLDMLLERVDPDDVIQLTIQDPPSPKHDASFTPSQAGRSSIDYLSYLQEFGVHQNVIIQYATDAVTLPKTIEYLKKSGFLEQYREYGLSMESYNNLTDNALHLGILCILFRRALTWALCSPSLENLRKLDIPLSDIERYLGVIHRFESLSDVTFIMDEQYIFNSTHLSRLSSNDPTKEAQILQRATTAFDNMILFVKRHTLMFKNVLKSVHQVETNGWESSAAPDRFHFQIQQLLPVLSYPRALDSGNWMQFVARADEVNLEQVQSIRINTSPTKWYQALTTDHAPFLPRCRNLITYQLVTLGPESFRWAVQEKKQRLATQTTGTLDLLPPVPLREVVISSVTDIFAGEIGDIAFGFSETLSKFVVYERTLFHAESPLPYFRIGRNWNLPWLRYLNCRSFQRTIALSPDIFSGCPFLERVETFDNFYEYDPLAIEYGQPAALPRLRGLELHGHSALQFHPDTLHTAGNLESLQLTMRSFNNEVDHFIPEAGDTMTLHPGTVVEASTTTPQRPIWTWDWYLPRIMSIELSATFAYTFQFKMLIGCPNIAKISLTISSRIPEHRRRLTMADLEVTVSETEGEHAQPTLPQRIVLPTLRSVLLTGLWQFSDEWIHILLHHVAPNLAQFEESRCQGFTLGGLVEAAKGTRLEQVTLSREYTEADLDAVGMVPGANATFDRWWQGYSWGGGSGLGLGGHAPAKAAESVHKPLQTYFETILGVYVLHHENVEEVVDHAT
ncbi:hypothetical protein BG006_007251 [Podila minutissima]|uniref:Uncharacterized protein n=1 Tax=Podila minutissima TaxID=64525 RepID=A0A9P5SLU3_9FUNG|nr:hypothetical protein BG006_007251 [Podila minutissima]